MKKILATFVLAGIGLAGCCVPHGTPSPTTTAPQNCEHSSNFPAPPGCPDDGSGPPTTTTTVPDVEAQVCPPLCGDEPTP